MQICVDLADYMIVGSVVGTDEFDPDDNQRVSRIEVARPLHGGIAPGETLAVQWSTGRKTYPDGMVRIASARGPQLSEISGVHLWLIVDDERGVRCTYHPIRVGADARSEMKRELEWAEHPRVPYGGSMADPAVREAKGVDLKVGDALREVLAAYLAGCLDSLGEE
jgi:hypothetical protein